MSTSQASGSGTKLTATQKSNRNRMRKIFTNLDSNDLVVTYLPSHRPKSVRGLKLDLAYGHDGFNIHSLMPSQQSQTPEGRIDAEGIRTVAGFDMPLLHQPKVDPKLEEELKKYWRSIHPEWSFYKNLKHQARKHLKYNQLQGQDVFEVGLVLGKELVSEEGQHFLLSILEKYGYHAGQIYSCKKFTDDLEKDIGGVKVTFRPHPDGTALDVKYLHEVHVLYDKDAKHRIPGSRQQSFRDNDVFLLEDLRVRRKTTMFCTPTGS